MEEGIMPHFKALVAEGSFAQMNSIFPTVSNVAWTSYQTGKNPGKFGVYGFAELTPEFDLYIPNSTNCRSKTIQEIVSEKGKEVISLGVPGSYPPRPVNGITVGGFLSPALEKAVYPPATLESLRETGYQLDINPMKARESLNYFKEETRKVLAGRVNTLFHLWDTQPWDLFTIHFMDTDRMGHFMFRFLDEGEAGSENHRYYLDFFRSIDDMLGRVREKLDERTRLIILSDHGFCRIRQEVQLNRWLQDRGYLSFSRPPGHDLDFEAISPQSKAFALVPGKIYILREGKWKAGRVPESEYSGLREEIIKKLENFTEAGRPVCKQILRKEDALWGEYLETAPDIIVDPCDGYDLKAGLKKSLVFESGAISGMHTYYDAMFYLRGADSLSKRPVVYDAPATILNLLGIEIPSDFDGVNLLGE
jgi:predicted AlkP superfamily phosphohydrolase/phosphomutase